MAITSATDDLATLAGEQPASSFDREYSGYPWWNALLVFPACEMKAADLLKKVNVFVYWPYFTVHKNARGRLHVPQRRSVIPGTLLVPIEMMEIKRRDEIFKLCHVRDFIRTTDRVTNDRVPARLSKAAVELIRQMEAKLYEPPPPDPTDDWTGDPGDPVRFKDELYAAFFGEVTVESIDLYPRIKVKGARLFGCARSFWTTASEIVAM